MTRIHPLPPYLNLIADYAVENMAKNGFELSDCLSTSVVIKVFERQVIFSQRVTKIKEIFDIDCWNIFHLSKTILDDENRSYAKIRITLEIKDGKLKSTTVKLYNRQA